MNGSYADDGLYGSYADDYVGDDGWDFIELDLTLCEAELLWDRKDEKGLRAYAIENIRDSHARAELRRLHDLARDGRRGRDYDQEIVGPLNRLSRLLSNERLRIMLGQREQHLDIRGIMDRGEIILANLMGAGEVYEREADLVGRLFTRSVLFHAKRRANYKPFTLLSDEGHRFLCGDVPTLLGEARKFGISVVTGLQWLEQAGADPNVLAGLLNVNTRIIFRIREAEDAERLARSSVPLDLERPVRALTRPTVTAHTRIQLTNESRTTSEAHTKGRQSSQVQGWAKTGGRTTANSHSDQSIWGASEHYSETETSNWSSGKSSSTSKSKEGIPKVLPLIGIEGKPKTIRVGESKTESESESEGGAFASAQGVARSSGGGTTDTRTTARSLAATRSGSASRGMSEAHTRGSGSSRGTSEALQPVLTNLPTAVHSLQNELYRAGEMVRSLPSGVALLNTVTRHGPVATLFRVPFIYIRKISRAAFIAQRDHLMATSAYSIRLDQARRAIEERVKQLQVPSDETPQKSQKKSTHKRFDEPEQGSEW